MYVKNSTVVGKQVEENKHKFHLKEYLHLYERNEHNGMQ